MNRKVKYSLFLSMGISPDAFVYAFVHYTHYVASKTPINMPILRNNEYLTFLFISYPPQQRIHVHSLDM